MEHGDPVRVDAGPWEARELVREYFPFLDTIIPQLFLIKIFIKSSWKVRHGAHLAALPRPPWPRGCSCSPDQPNPGVTPWSLVNILTNPTLWQYCNKPMLRCKSNCTLIYFLQTICLVLSRLALALEKLCAIFVPSNHKWSHVTGSVECFTAQT